MIIGSAVLCYHRSFCSFKTQKKHLVLCGLLVELFLPPAVGPNISVKIEDPSFWIGFTNDICSLKCGATAGPRAVFVHIARLILLVDPGYLPAPHTVNHGKTFYLSASHR